MKRIVLATKNAKKATELNRMLQGLGIHVLSLAEYPDMHDVEETGHTFSENAFLKARAVATHTGLPALADDSGLVVDALEGAPGVYSARYAGPGAKDEDNCRKLLAELQGVPDHERTAHFACALALVLEDKSELLFEGTVEGHIGHAPAGHNGFGYDPLFYPDGHDRSFAQMSSSEKDSMSHRGRALEKFMDFLKTRNG